ncbi:hypothetical protein CR513_54312, partial [Mucuna pruriens]
MVVIRRKNKEEIDQKDHKGEGKGLGSGRLGWIRRVLLTFYTCPSFDNCNFLNLKLGLHLIGFYLIINAKTLYNILLRQPIPNTLGAGVITNRKIGEDMTHY